MSALRSAAFFALILSASAQKLTLTTIDHGPQSTGYLRANGNIDVVLDSNSGNMSYVLLTKSGSAYSAGSVTTVTCVR